MTADGARRLFGSFPNVNELGPSARAELLDAIGVLVLRLGGVVQDPYVTVLYPDPATLTGLPVAKNSALWPMRGVL